MVVPARGPIAAGAGPLSDQPYPEISVSIVGLTSIWAEPSGRSSEAARVAATHLVWRPVRNLGCGGEDVTTAVPGLVGTIRYSGFPISASRYSSAIRAGR